MSQSITDGEHHQRVVAARRRAKGRTDMTDTKPSTKRSSSARTSANVLSDEERAAMQETIRERKKAAKRSPEEQRAEGEADVQAKIAEMAEDDRAIAARVHELVLAAAPGLVPRTFYGMPHVIPAPQRDAAEQMNALLTS